MERYAFSPTFGSTPPPASRLRQMGLWLGIAALVLAAFFASAAASQVLTVDTSGRNGPTVHAPVDHQFQQIEPTHVPLSTSPMDVKDRLEIVRIMQAEQGFAMRPFPKGRKGLTLVANGELQPAGEAYLNAVTSDGLSTKPGDRVVITNIRIEKDKIVFDLNGGPDARHRFLRHISVGTGGYDNPVVQGGDDPGGSRLTLTFKDHVPDMTGAQVKALLAPLISFDVKTPVQAFTDTLPKPLKDAILGHEVLVGMTTDMVMFAKGQPKNKIREMDGQMPIEIWLYGTPPQDVTFVRINGNRVIRVELAKVGKPVQVFEKDVVSPMLMGTSAQGLEQAQNVRVVHEGDVQRDPNRQAPAPPPTLRNPGETLPDNANQTGGEMKPVHFPKQQPVSQPGQNPDDQQPSAPAPAGGQGNAAPQPAQPAPASGADQSH